MSLSYSERIVGGVRAVQKIHSTCWPFTADVIVPEQRSGEPWHFPKGRLADLVAYTLDSLDTEFGGLNQRVSLKVTPYVRTRALQLAAIDHPLVEDQIADVLRMLLTAFREGVDKQSRGEVGGLFTAACLKLEAYLTEHRLHAAATVAA